MALPTEGFGIPDDLQDVSFAARVREDGGWFALMGFISFANVVGRRCNKLDPFSLKVPCFQNLKLKVRVLLSS